MIFIIGVYISYTKILLINDINSTYEQQESDLFLSPQQVISTRNSSGQVLESCSLE